MRGTACDSLLCSINEALISCSFELVLLFISTLGYLFFSASGSSALMPRTADDKSVKEAALEDSLEDSSKSEQDGQDHDVDIMELTESSTGGLHRCHSQAVWVTLLFTLPSEVAANIFLFGELGDVLNCAGVTCRKLHVTLWRQPDFWMHIGGPVFVKSLQATVPPAASPDLVLGAFRRWVFRIEGEWSLYLEQAASCGPPATALREVQRLVQGLRPGDALLSDIWRLVRAVECGMQCADVSDDEAFSAASGLVARCCTRQDIFGSIDIEDLRAALSAMEERKRQQRLDNENSPSEPWSFFMAELDDVQDPTQEADNLDDFLPLLAASEHQHPT